MDGNLLLVNLGIFTSQFGLRKIRSELTKKNWFLVRTDHWSSQDKVRIDQDSNGIKVLIDQCLNISEVQNDQSYYYFPFFFFFLFFSMRGSRGGIGDAIPGSIFQNIGLCKIYRTTPGRKQDPQNKDNKNKTYIHNCIIQESRNFELKIGPAKWQRIAPTQSPPPPKNVLTKLMSL